MKKLIIILALFIHITLIFAVSDYSAYLDNEIGIDDYPNASAINIYTEINLSVNEDYSYDYSVFYIKKILTYMGKKRYSDVKFEYCADYEEIEFGDCCTINSEGVRIEIPEEALHDSEVYWTLLSPEYVNQWEKIINYPEIEPGSYIIVNYTEKNNRKDYVSGIEHLMEENPYLEKKFTVTYPETINMYIDPLRVVDNLEIEKANEMGFIKETFTIKNAELIPSEMDSPDYVYTGCPIAYSSEKDWVDLSSKIFEEFNSGIEITDQITEISREITMGINDERGKVFAIYDYLARNYTTKMSFLYTQEFKPEPQKKVLERKYGSQRDIVALFLGLAKAAGIDDCYPVLQLDSNLRYHNIQDKTVLRDFISQINVWWDNTLLLPGNDSLPFGYAGIESCNIIIGKKKPVFTEYAYDSSKLISKKTICKAISDNEYAIDYLITYSGSQDSQYRSQFRNESEENTKIWFSNQLGDKSSILSAGPEFINLEDLNTNVELKYTTKVKGFLIRQGTYAYFTLPLEKIELSVGAQKRVLPYQIERTFSCEEEFVIENIPTDLKVIKPEKGTKDVFKFGKQKISYSIDIKHNNDTIIFRRIIEIPEGIIPVDDYGEFRDFVNDMNNPTNSVIFMEMGD
ncbi:MAG: DUF3857 and transglutaminase domain-containing protein [Candidatus Stygibacter australis]|nr:DUF3857 and transglutaminase domain-containing protein [Candidatus Stygibacter australis]MDP8321048.1 DUF3857 and transglutaminase domain-containing protein [Candidatus Stygibacter australis]